MVGLLRQDVASKGFAIDALWSVVAAMGILKLHSRGIYRQGP